MIFNLYMILYESFHAVAVRSREDEMKRAGLYEDMQGEFSHRHWRRNWIDYTCLPLTGTLYGTIPGVMAELSHLFTDRLVYTVSAKPLLQRRVAGEVDKGIALA